MKALVYVGKEKVEVLDVVEPEINEGEVKIRVTYCGICGSDIGIYKGVHPRAKAPLILGHEFVGIVEETSENSKFNIGDRVVPYPLISCGECYACLNGIPHVCKSLKLLGIDLDGGVAEFTKCSEDVIFKIPDEISDKVASLIEPLAVAIRTAHRTNLKIGSKVVVLGAGPIGLLTAIVARNAGAEKIILMDIDEKRLKIARELGFDSVNSLKIDFEKYVLENTNGYGADIVFECTGSSQAVKIMTDVCRIDGTICMTATHHGTPEVNLQAINFKEQTILGSRVYTKSEFETAVEMCKFMEDDLKKLVTHIVPLQNGDRVFEIIKDEESNNIKIIVDCRL